MWKVKEEREGTHVLQKIQLKLENQSICGSLQCWTNPLRPCLQNEIHVCIISSSNLPRTPLQIR